MLYVRLVKNPFWVYPTTAITKTRKLIEKNDFVMIDFSKVVKEEPFLPDYKWYEVLYRDTEGRFKKKGYALIKTTDIRDYPVLTFIEKFKTKISKYLREMPTTKGKIYITLTPGTSLHFDRRESVKHFDGTHEWYPVVFGDRYGWVGLSPGKFFEQFAKEEIIPPPPGDKEEEKDKEEKREKIIIEPQIDLAKMLLPVGIITGIVVLGLLIFTRSKKE